MSDKYTIAGDKVEIVSNLPNCQFLVKPVYVDEAGNESVLGKSFVVDEILDKPVKQWHEKEREKQEAWFKSSKKSMADELDRLRKNHATATARLSGISKFLNDMARKFERDGGETFSTLSKYINGEIEYLVVSGYSSHKIVKFENAIENKCSFDAGLKLISLYGASNGDVSWRLNQYSDTSGSSETIIPCETYLDAVAVLDNLIKADCQERVTYSQISAKEKYSLENPTAEQIQGYNDIRVKEIAKQLNTLENSKTKLRSEMESLL